MKTLDCDFWLAAQWPVPDHIQAGTTLRVKRKKELPYSSFNLATHVGDDSDQVMLNRARLVEELNLPGEPYWLEQTHRCDIAECSKTAKTVLADASYSRAAEQVCVVLTADCVPLLLCNRAGSQIAAVHIGWRGLCGNIIKQALAAFTDEPADILAWLGPHISQKHYEVGAEVIQACNGLLKEASEFMIETKTNHGLLDLGGMVEQLLKTAGLTHIYTANMCTYANEELFYSYRKTAVTGRMATLIWSSTQLTSAHK